jgi:Pentapeptide repeats (8 copies)
MSNSEHPDPQDLIKRDLEIKKLRREIQQLTFAADKQGFMSPAGEANFEKTKRELDLAGLCRLEAQDLREAARADLEKSKLDQEIGKLKRERQQLDADARPGWARMLRWSRIIGPFGSFLTGTLALIVSGLSFCTTSRLSEQQTNKLKLDQILEQDKFFGDILEKATDPTAPLYQRGPFIAALDAFWNKRQSPALASALLSMIVHDPANEIQQACKQEIDRAWAAAQQNERPDVNSVLFGSRAKEPDVEGRMGVVQVTWTLLNDHEPPLGDKTPVSDPRKAALLQIISKAGPHLENTNFAFFIAEGLLLPDAKFKGADLHGVHATEWTLSNADLSQCDLQYAIFTNCELDGAILKKAVLTGAIFRGSDLENADFTNAKLGDPKIKNSLACANILQVHGLDHAYREEAFNQGAVEMSRNDYDRWKHAGMNLPGDLGERRSWRQAGSLLNDKGDPTLPDD